MPIKVLTSLALVFVVLLTDQYAVSRSKPLTVYSPPIQVMVQMFSLDPVGGGPLAPCTTGDTNWGCTAFCNNSTQCVSGTSKPYPYSSSDITIPIESEYLPDVVAHEAMPGVLAAVAVEANAIAARSYTYGHIRAQSTSLCRGVLKA